MTRTTCQVHILACTACLLVACARSSSPSPEPARGPTEVFIPVAPPSRSATLDSFQPDLAAVDGPFECGPSSKIGETPAGRVIAGPDAVSYFGMFPNRADAKATVTVIVDSTGKIIRYAERRGPPLRPQRGATASAADVAAAAAAVRSTTITLDYRTGRAIVGNNGGGGPDQSVFGPVDIVGRLEKFGKPLDRAARVLAQCRVSQ